MSTNRLLCVRFDADTPICCGAGLRNIAELAHRHEFRFTVFVNPGRALDRRALFRFRAERDQRAPCAEKLHPLRKLGVRETLRLMLLNPASLPRCAPTLRAVADAGHEIGLHGGRNHGDWQRNADSWSYSTVLEQIRWGKEAIEASGVPPPRAFASPGWVSPPGLEAALEACGFTLLADAHGHGSGVLVSEPGETRLRHARTALTGEPGGVGYLEHLTARRLSRGEVFARFQEDLDRTDGRAVMYDHPFFAGRDGIGLLEELVLHARNLGWTIVPLSHLVG